MTIVLKIRYDSIKSEEEMHLENKELVTSDKETLKLYIKEAAKKEWLIVTHGLGEHGARHTDHIIKITQEYNVLFWDLRGHGQSSGKKGWVDSFEDYSRDLKEVVEYLQREYQMKQYRLLGHSMGGLVVASFLTLHADDVEMPKSVFLSSPAISAAGAFGTIFNFVSQGVTTFMAKSLPSIAIAGILDLKKLSHDPMIYQKYISDPLNTLKISTHLFFELINHAKLIFSKKINYDGEWFAAIGTEDVLVDPDAVCVYFSEVVTKADLLIVKGAYHEMHNEIDKYQQPFMDHLVKFLK